VGVALGLALGQVLLQGNLSISQCSSYPVESSASSSFATNIPPSMERIVAGMSRMSRDSFLGTFDVGMGNYGSTDGNSQVLLLHTSQASLPRQTLNGKVAPLLSVKDATAKCSIVKVIMTNASPGKESLGDCVAIVGSWESNHVHKFAPHKGTNHNTDGSTQPRTWQYTSGRRFPPPSVNTTRTSLWELQTYLDAYPAAVERLRPLAQAAALGRDGRVAPLLVMVTNFGQAQLLVNFVCSARARGLDISRLLLFATDRETSKLAESLGIPVFLDEAIFGAIPSGAAKGYEDANYGRIMMCKVYVAHLISVLGYDFLFQDVDIVWYRNPPLDKFRNSNYDMIFQHDGHYLQERFQPMMANSGFYFVRANARTKYFFALFIRMGDLVLQQQSHQAALSTLLNEQMSLRGLRVKVLLEDELLYLSGYHMEKEPEKWSRALQASPKPYLLHANWLDGNQKRPMLNETRNWFLTTICSDRLSQGATDASECCTP
jgi:hypothetical protein